jgi:hypothetical protein
LEISEVKELTRITRELANRPTGARADREMAAI